MAVCWCPKEVATSKQQFLISNFFYFALWMAQGGWIECEKCSRVGQFEVFHFVIQSGNCQCISLIDPILSEVLEAAHRSLSWAARVLVCALLCSMALRSPCLPEPQLSCLQNGLFSGDEKGWSPGAYGRISDFLALIDPCRAVSNLPCARSNTRWGSSSEVRLAHF